MPKILPLLLLFAQPLYAAPAPCPGLDKAAAGVAAAVAEKPAGLEGLFDATFFEKVSAAQISSVLSALYRKTGPVTGVTLVSTAPACSAHYLLGTSGGWLVPAAVTLNAGTGRVAGLFLGAPYRKDATLASARAELAALHGKAGLEAVRFGEKPEVLEELNAGDTFAVGSAFKLYVLGAMLEAKAPWAKVVRLREEDKSLPTGRLRTWPDGSPLTLHTLATLMISESDNTAADALISALGRRRIEAALPALGNTAPDQLRPFLKTSEFFRLKADPEALLKYRNLPEERKYDFLAGLRAPLAPPGAAPFGLRGAEWPVSPADLCRVMKYFLDRDDRTALEVLAVNPGQDLPPDTFLYAGYKGGSEPGVLAAAWLLKTRASEWYCLAAAWNDETAVLDEAGFFGIMKGALRSLAARE